jgi:hypothetical protein
MNGLRPRSAFFVRGQNSLLGSGLGVEAIAGSGAATVVAVACSLVIQTELGRTQTSEFCHAIKKDPVLQQAATQARDEYFPF